jgi:adenosylhomocysteinase
LRSPEEPADASNRDRRDDARVSSDSGASRIDWADGQMPVLRSVRERFEKERPLDGVKLGACLHVTAETANLVRTLAAGGADVALCAPNPLSTQDAVAAVLGEEMLVRAARGVDPRPGIAEIAAWGPEVTLDDGADLIALLHDGDAIVDGFLGATEETTTGLVRVRQLQLRCPVLALNEARTERVFNDHYGTGQSTLDGILRATNILFAGRTIVVHGYGFAGRGIATRARGAGAHVIVCEVDPLAALTARMEGFEVMPSLEAAARGDVFITVTGTPGVLSSAHFEQMKDGAVLANAGHFDVEIDLEALAASATRRETVLPLVESFVIGGRRIHLLAQGRVVNLAASQGHPAEIMDISFAVHALAAAYLVALGGTLAPGVHAVPDEIDREVARLKLSALSVRIDELTPEQQAYRSSWSGGS